MSQTCSGEQTIEGCTSPKRKITLPSGPKYCRFGLGKIDER